MTTMAHKYKSGELRSNEKYVKNSRILEKA